ncbi:hypothetical protein BH09BAC1_BH09BAC1_14690 [soil metagenome]
MKHLLSLLIISIIAFAATSCGGNGSAEGTENTEATVASWSMTALVDSVDWQAKDVTTYEDQGTLYITGVATDGSKVILEMGVKPSIGIFSIRRGTVQAATYVAPSGSKYYAPFGGTTGVINITGYASDSMVSGEFNFGASNTLDLHIISEGAFVAPVTKKDVATPIM